MKKLPKSTDPLLTRDEFREAVFARDNHKCVICKTFNNDIEAKDAHHILERRLFTDGGYYLSNGASLCAHHHIIAEQTTLSVEEIREACKITNPALPDHFYPDQRYTKWGDAILDNGQRTKGELFYDESVQKILKEGGILNLFTDYVKYPRTFHLPWSPGATDDDRIMRDLKVFEGEQIIITEKMDGENTSLYYDYYHARSLDSNSHISQSWARAFHGNFKHDIPQGWRICAENLFAKHSIQYDNLESYLLVFSIWDEKNNCLNWETTMEWINILGLNSVPIIYSGLWDKQFIENLKINPNSEGYVVRIARSFSFNQFKNVVAKYVRKDHVQTTHHWKKEILIKNGLKNVD